MSPAKHHRRRRLGGLLAAGSALAIGIGVIIGNQVTGGGVGPAPPGAPSTTLANVFIDANGGTCARNTTTGGVPYATADATSCSSMSAAYVAAACGDNVLIHTSPSAYQTISPAVSKTCSNTAGCREAWTFGDNTTSTVDYSSCVTFQYESGNTTQIGGVSCGGGSGALAIGVPYVRLIGLKTPLPATTTQNPCMRIGYYSAVNLPCSSWNVHDVIADGITSSTFLIGGADAYVTVENGSFGPGYASQSTPVFVNACTTTTPSLSMATTEHFAMVNNVVHNYLQDTAPNGTPPAHLEGIHWQGGNSSLVARNKFYDITQQDISVQTNCGAGATVCTVNDVLFENNQFSESCGSGTGFPNNSFCGQLPSGGGLTFICDNSVDHIERITVRNNSFAQAAGGPSLQSSGCSSQTTGGFGPFTFTGNIIPNCTQSLTASVTYSYNQVFASSCSAGGGTGNSTSLVQASTYVDQTYPTLDFTQLVGSPTIDFLAGSGVSCPAKDLPGVTRPQGAGCDAGAYEDVSSNKGTGGSSATCTPSPCTNGTVTNGTVVADDGAGTNATFNYHVYRPAGLTNSSSNLAPAMVAFTPTTGAENTGGTSGIGCSPGNGTGWAACDLRPLADANKFVIIYITSNHQLPSSVYASGAIVQACPHIDGSCVTFSEATAGAACTFSSGTGVPARMCEDGPQVKATLDKLVCAGASPCENIDPNKVFAYGESKGGIAVESAALCDPLTTSRFRGGVVVSEQLVSKTATNVGPPWCPNAVTPANHDLSMEWIYGDGDTLLSCASGTGAGSNTTGCVNGKGDWTYGQNESATKVANPLLGCSNTPTSTTGGNGQAFIDTYSGCTIASRGVRVIRLHSCGHALPALQNCDSFDVLSEIWAYLSSH